MASLTARQRINSLANSVSPLQWTEFYSSSPFKWTFAISLRLESEAGDGDSRSAIESYFS
ncbi:hypothetical protein [Argonema galeatum]|uniref:hypothetical protein n=1 Tax=Argonema galeatum TaxID=2942762 RepID=UPI002012FE53|nr:hypothetical protein [Argonema galeatum]MCL1464050.1 hypothetical protein [Argonema galeatum A003/A1]